MLTKQLSSPCKLIYTLKKATDKHLEHPSDTTTNLTLNLMVRSIDIKAFCDRLSRAIYGYRAYNPIHHDINTGIFTCSSSYSKISDIKVSYKNNLVSVYIDINADLSLEDIELT